MSTGTDDSFTRLDIGAALDFALRMYVGKSLQADEAAECFWETLNACPTVAPQTPASERAVCRHGIVLGADGFAECRICTETQAAQPEGPRVLAQDVRDVADAIAAGCRDIDQQRDADTLRRAAWEMDREGPRVTLEQVEATLNDEAQRLFSNHPQGTRDRVQGLVNATIARLLSKCRKPARHATNSEGV